jgi:haloacetate dehalogenase
VFEGFQLEFVNVGDATLRVRHGGSGPPVVLLHGHPRTHVTWHRVAPLLAERHTVVCPDLRGYGESSKPPTTEDHEPYSKRAMARDIVALMQHLGHDRFAIVGHDRGSYVGLRAALDHPDAVTRLVFMGAVPIVEALERADASFAAAWWHWFFFGQTSKPAEDWINRDPDAWYTGSAEHMGQAAFEDYRRAIRNPDVVHAMVEDYRAGLGIDRRHGEEDRAAGRKVGCPTLVLWAERDDAEELYGDLRPIWEAWADDLRVEGIDSGHHMAEEAPKVLTQRLLAFLTEPAS